MTPTKSFIEISPSKDKKFCQNCKHFDKWGVHAGICCVDNKGYNKMDWQTCKKFEKK